LDSFYQKKKVKSLRIVLRPLFFPQRHGTTYKWLLFRLCGSKGVELHLMSQLELEVGFQNGKDSSAMGISGLQTLPVFSFWKD